MWKSSYSFLKILYYKCLHYSINLVHNVRNQNTKWTEPFVLTNPKLKATSNSNVSKSTNHGPENKYRPLQMLPNTIYHRNLVTLQKYMIRLDHMASQANTSICCLIRQKKPHRYEHFHMKWNVSENKYLTNQWLDEGKNVRVSELCKYYRRMWIISILVVYQCHNDYFLSDL